MSKFRDVTKPNLAEAQIFVKECRAKNIAPPELPAALRAWNALRRLDYSVHCALTEIIDRKCKALVHTTLTPDEFRVPTVRLTDEELKSVYPLAVLYSTLMAEEPLEDITDKLHDQINAVGDNGILRHDNALTVEEMVAIATPIWDGQDRPGLADYTRALYSHIVNIYYTDLCRRIHQRLSSANTKESVRAAIFDNPDFGMKRGGTRRSHHIPIVYWVIVERCLDFPHTVTLDILKHLGEMLKVHQVKRSEFYSKRRHTRKKPEPTSDYSSAMEAMQPVDLS